jgi:nicotinate-nucleotide pyrophosphorylase (carboxylating)
LELAEAAFSQLVSVALAEDGAKHDLTTRALNAPARVCTARIFLEEPGVLAGLPIAAAVFRRLDAGCRLTRQIPEGAELERPPIQVAELDGPARAILSGERTALNLVSRLSGIATLTRLFVDEVAGTRATILDTRKTTPGLRTLEKYAVRCGGGKNHRFGLHDAVLIKDNHLALAGGIDRAVSAIRAAHPGTPIEIEIERIEQVEEAIDAGADRILLDNMTPGEVADAVAVTAGRVSLEASGGITLANVRAYADTGVDFISVGALTQQAPALRVSLDVT